MDLDEQFEPVSDAVALPDKLLAAVMKHHQGLKRVDVEKKTGKNSWHKVNGFTVENDTLGKPKDPPERLATMIVAIAMTDVEASGSDETYRAKFFKDEDGESVRRTFAFKQKLGEDPDPVNTPDEDGDVIALFGTAMQQILTFVQIQNAHVEHQNARILSQSEMATSQIKQLLDTHETLINKYHEGLTMQANALTLMLDVERNLEADKQKGKNTEKLLGMMDKALPAALTQFSQFVAGKTGAPTEDEDEDEDEDTKGSSNEQGETHVVQLPQQDPEQAALEKKMKEKPLTTFAHAFKDSLTSDQLMDLTDALTKKQMRSFRDATSKKDDDSTAESILKFRDAMMKTPQVFGKVQEILNEKQFQMIMRLNELAAERENKEDESD